MTPRNDPAVLIHRQSVWTFNARHTCRRCWKWIMPQNCLNSPLSEAANTATSYRTIRTGRQYAKDREFKCFNAIPHSCEGGIVLTQKIWGHTPTWRDWLCWTIHVVLQGPIDYVHVVGIEPVTRNVDHFVKYQVRQAKQKRYRCLLQAQIPSWNPMTSNVLMQDWLIHFSLPRIQRITELGRHHIWHKMEMPEGWDVKSIPDYAL